MDIGPGTRNLTEHIAQTLREMIIRKELNPGDRFPTEPELIERFGVGRSTVREAIKILRAENVIEIKRGIGTFISDSPGISNDPLGLSYADENQLFANLMETRMIIEPQIASLAANRATEANLKKLKKILDRLEQDKKPSAEHSKLDIDFHTAIAECTQNDVLERILPIINESISVGYTATADVPGTFERAKQHHRLIFEAICKRDPDQARKETVEHLNQTMQDMKIKRRTPNEI